MKVQITLTINEGKRIIAKGLAHHPLVRKALKEGQIFLKGGTTVSALAEELVQRPMRISGRISPKGTKAANDQTGGYHCSVIKNGELVDADASLMETVSGLTADDVAVIGANAVDVYGNAAMMYGSALGGGPGIIISGLLAELPNVFVAAGLEKLVPGSLTNIIPKVARKGVHRSMGMTVGLTPISGHIISEDKALELLAEVECTVIGRGGVMGAEGAVTLLVQGDESQVMRAFDIAMEVKGAQISGTKESVPECFFPNAKCKSHLACVYKRKTKPEPNK